MFTKNRIVLQGLMLVVAIGMFAGCSSSGKKQAGATARAVKGLDTTTSGGTDPFDLDGRPTGTPISLDEYARSKGVPNLCARILFDLDKSEVKAEFIPCLDSIAVFLTNFPDVEILVEGHCDERGTPEYNLSLGEKRAVTTVDYLIAKGVNASRFVTRSLGEEKPVALGTGESVWKQNRRADFFAIQ